MGFENDVYKLTMLTHRKKQEIIDSIELLPGHKQRMIDLFRRIDNVSTEQFRKKSRKFIKSVRYFEDSHAQIKFIYS